MIKCPTVNPQPAKCPQCLGKPVFGALRTVCEIATDCDREACQVGHTHSASLLSVPKQGEEAGWQTHPHRMQASGETQEVARGSGERPSGQFSCLGGFGNVAGRTTGSHLWSRHHILPHLDRGTQKVPYNAYRLRSCAEKERFSFYQSSAHIPVLHRDP